MPDPTIEQVADRIAIDDLLTRYTIAIDTKNYDGLDDVFTPDATIDYTTSGGPRGPYPEIKIWLGKALAQFAMTQHLLGNKSVQLDGDTATSRTYFYNPMGFPKPDGSLHLFYVGGYYVDRLVRTTDGWRIAERVEEQAWMDGTLPAGLTIPE